MVNVYFKAPGFRKFGLIDSVCKYSASELVHNICPSSTKDAASRKLMSPNYFTIAQYKSVNTKAFGRITQIDPTGKSALYLDAGGNNPVW